MEYSLKLPVIIETEDEALAEIRAADTIIGKDFLSRPDFDKVSRVTSGTLVRKFGSWQELLYKAGLGEKYSGPSITTKLRGHENRFLSDDEILDELRRIASILQTNTLTRNDIRNNSEIIADTIIVNRFGSLKKGFELAGLKTSRNYRERIDDIKYLENILSVWTFHGRQPTANEMNATPSAISKMHISTDLVAGAKHCSLSLISQTVITQRNLKIRMMLLFQSGIPLRGQQHGRKKREG